MAEQLLSPFSKFIVAAGTVVAATSNSAVITLPLADSYAFVLNVTAAAGTTETMDVAIQLTPDAGTTWFDWFRFAQVAQAAVTRRLVVQPLQGRGEAGTEAVITSAGTGALAANAPFPGSNMQVRFAYTLGGTAPSYTLGIAVIAQARATAV